MTDKKVIKGVTQVQEGVKTLLEAFEENPELHDTLDIQKLIPMSLDEWELELATKLEELGKEGKYDYEKENFKTCPVCQTTIDYHIHGFYHDEDTNEWICRDHIPEIRERVAKKPQPEFNWHRCDEIGSFVAVYDKHSLYIVAMLKDGSMEYDEYGQLNYGDVDDVEGLLADLSEFSRGIIVAEMAAS